MRLNHLLTTEQLSAAQKEAQTKTSKDYDSCISTLIDRYYDTRSQEVRDSTAAEIKNTFDRMMKDCYSQNCVRTYMILWNYVKNSTNPLA